MSDGIERRVSDLEEWRREDVEPRLRVLEDDMSEIKTELRNMATKDDIRGVHSKIDASVNGLLRDALNAQPMKQSALWAGLLLVVTVLALVITVIHQ